jgi:deazaflavin-dependent oxidoreductase (nitroreductase family)
MSRLERMNNALFRALIRLGIAPGGASLLTVTGRRSGRPRSIPVNPIDRDGERWLVAPYGAVGWVENVRACHDVTLTRRHHATQFRAVEVSPDVAGSVLRDYVRKIRIARPYFDATPESPIQAFAAEADRHPVFRLDRP